MSQPSLPFYKIHASGNDFVLLKASDLEPDHLVPNFIQQVCDRHHGIGADGIMLYDLDTDQLTFQHLDPDGSRSLCLNGTRAALGSLHKLGLIPEEGVVLSEGQEITYILSEGVTIGQHKHHYQPLLWEMDDWSVSGFIIDVGNPHFCFIDGPPLNQLPELAPAIRNDLATFPDGTNVHRLWQEGTSWRIRSFERGVEGFTCACGSGMLAAATILLDRYPETTIHFQPDGQDPVSCYEKDGQIMMTGRTVLVARGDYLC